MGKQSIVVGLFLLLGAAAPGAALAASGSIAMTVEDDQGVARACGNRD